MQTFFGPLLLLATSGAFATVSFPEPTRGHVAPPTHTAGGSIRKASKATAGGRPVLKPATTPPAPFAKNIVLVHGALVDGSGWQKVFAILTKDGYHVSIVQNPLTSLDDDVLMTKRVLDQQDRPTVLVGHSYGGTVITVAGTHPNVTTLVYLAAFQPEKGESTADLFATMPLVTAGGTKSTGDHFSFFPADKFAPIVAADVPKDQADFMAASQVYVADACTTTKASAAAWHDKPSYGLVATDDKAVNPALERFMYKRSGTKTTEVKSSHMVYISHPQVVAALIEEAAHRVN